MLGFEMASLRINLFIQTLKILGPKGQSIFVIFDKDSRVKTENISLSTKLCLNISLSFSMSHIDCLSKNYIFYINIFSQFYKDNPQFVFRLLLKSICFISIKLGTLGSIPLHLANWQQENLLIFSPHPFSIDNPSAFFKSTVKATMRHTI